MQQGVRITSGVEIADRDTPPDYSQIRRSVALARDGHEMKGEIEDTPWMGRRPTMVDSLPMIGPAPRHDGLWFNFGHQHVGLSMGPGSALAITARLDGRVAILVGGGQMPGQAIGNGRAAAITYARAGARVLVVDRSINAAKQTVDKIAGEGGEAIAFEADVTQEDNIRAMIGAATSTWGNSILSTTMSAFR